MIEFLKLYKKVFDGHNLGYFFKLFYIFLKTNNLEPEIQELIKSSINPPIQVAIEKNHLNLFVIPEVVKHTFFKSYPKYGEINGKMYPLFTGDIDKLCEEYCKKINYSIDKHKEVLSLLKYGKENKLINIGFEKFVLSYYWETLKELENEKNEISFESEDV